MSKTMSQKESLINIYPFKGELSINSRSYENVEEKKALFA